MERRSPTGIARGSAKPAPTTPPPTNLTARSAGLRPASRGSAKPAPTTLRHANLTVERRSLTGIARERETRTNNAAPRQSHGGAPVSDRHRAGARNPHQRRCATPNSRPGAPVSDRHRAGARNLHQQRRPPPISRLQTHASPTANNHGGAPVSDRHRAGARNLHRRRCATPAPIEHRSGPLPTTDLSEQFAIANRPPSAGALTQDSPRLVQFLNGVSRRRAQLGDALRSRATR